MKKTVRIAAIAFLVIICLTCAGCTKEITADDWKIRNEIKMNDTMSDVRKKDNLSYNEGTRMADGNPMLSAEPVELMGIKDSRLLYYFNGSKKLYEVSYAFSDATGDVSGDYDRIENELEKQYGAKRDGSLGFHSVKGQAEQGYEICVDLLEDYVKLIHFSERIIDGKDYSIKIEHIIYKTTFGSSSNYSHQLSFVIIPNP